jgi:cysteine desulfurase
MSKRSIYLDHAATTPVDPRVIEAMLPYLREQFGNASALHAYGRRAERALEDARAAIAHCLGCTPDEIVFTSGGSESDNLAVRGAAWAGEGCGRAKLVTTPIEHPAVLRTAEWLNARHGFGLSLLPVDPLGRVVETGAAAQIDDETALVSVMFASNEIGTLQPVSALAEMARAHGAMMHTDAVQAAGLLPLDVRALGVDLLSLSAHKFYAPQGAGALYVRAGTALDATQTGGAQESNRRAGTHNLAGIVGMATALTIACEERESVVPRITMLRDRLIDGVLRLPGVALTGHPTERLPNHASFIVDGVDASTLLIHLDVAGVMASSGSACKVGNAEPSEVLLALGYDERQALSGLRLTLGRETTEAEIDAAITIIEGAIARARRVQAVME